MTTKEIRRDAERIRSRHRLRMRAFRKGALIFFPDGSGTTPVRLDGGPGSGFFGHAGIPGQVGGSSPAGGAPCAETASRTGRLKSSLEKQSASYQAAYLIQSGVVPAGEAAVLESGVNSSDDNTREEALQKLDEYREEYIANAEEAGRPKEISTAERDRVAAMPDEEAREWVAESTGRDLTAEEETWANWYNELQKVVLDLDLTGTPQVVCEEDFKAYVEENDATVIYRGLQDSVELSASNIIYQFAYEDGRAYMGNGVFGNGIYFSTERDTADFYARDNSSNVITCAVRTDAKILDYSSDEFQAVMDRLESDDSSIAAVCAGYDIVQVEDYYIVLNRSALVMLDPMEEAAEQTIRSMERSEET